MSGKLCDGGTFAKAAKPSNSKAYCEGRTVATAGGLIGENPHASGTEEADCWDAGFGSYNGGVGTPLALDCCAQPAYDGVP